MNSTQYVTYNTKIIYLPSVSNNIDIHTKTIQYQNNNNVQKGGKQKLRKDVQIGKHLSMKKYVEKRKFF